MTPYEIETLKQEQLNELIETFGIQDLDDQEKIVFLAKECIRLRTLYFQAYDTMKAKVDERVHDKYKGMLDSARREATKQKNRYIRKLEQLTQRFEQAAVETPEDGWVGLTDEDIGSCPMIDVDAFEFAYEIEAKLKEKNASIA